MANTYTQLYIQIVSVVKFRQAIIMESWEDRLHKYIIAIVQKNEHKVLAINSAYDHVHLFISLNPKQSISELMKQEGLGAFSLVDRILKMSFGILRNKRNITKNKVLRKNMLNFRTFYGRF